MTPAKWFCKPILETAWAAHHSIFVSGIRLP